MKIENELDTVGLRREWERNLAYFNHPAYEVEYQGCLLNIQLIDSPTPPRWYYRECYRIYMEYDHEAIKWRVALYRRDEQVIYFGDDYNVASAYFEIACNTFNQIKESDLYSDIWVEILSSIRE